MPCNSTLHSNVPLGLAYILHGSLYMIPYVLCVRVMLAPNMRSRACYKLMLAMANVDLCNLILMGLVSGAMSIVGMKYCPDSYYIARVIGSLGSGLWCSYCVLCVTLAFNRYAECTGKAAKYFHGRKTWFWVFGAAVYGLGFFTMSMSSIGSITYHAGRGHFVIKPNNKLMLLPALFNNVLVPATIAVIYVLISLKHFQLRSMNGGESGKDADEIVNKVMLTSFLISFLVCACGMGSMIIIRFIKEYPFLLAVSHVWLQMCHGSNCLIYLGLNKTIRDQVFKNITKTNNNTVQVLPAQQV